MVQHGSRRAPAPGEVVVRDEELNEHLIQKMKSGVEIIS
jgi:hypothetical protein